MIGRVAPTSVAHCTPATRKASGRGKEGLMRHTLLALLAALALIGGGSAARSADTQALERALDQWAVSWASGDVDKLLPLFTDDVRYEDVTFGAVNQGKNALRDFAATTFGAFADLKFELKSRLLAAAGRAGALGWALRGGAQKRAPRHT